MAREPKPRLASRRGNSSEIAAKLTVFIGAAGLIGILSGWIGYEIGLRDSETQGGRLQSALQVMFAAERVALDGEKQEVGEHLNALALKLGEMRAELMRLEAMGQRLVQKGQLDGEEFNFTAAPALGGPESADDAATKMPDLMADLDELSRRIGDRVWKLALLEDLLLSREVIEESRPAGLPVAAGWISSHYGWRTDPINGKKNHHRGIDFAGKSGSNIIAVADGVVTWAAARSGYGKTVEIKHGNGYLTRYAHNRSLKVKKGDIVRQGDVIASMGRSGRATGTHLHFEVIRNGKTVNPLRFVKSPRTDRDEG